MCVFVGTRSNIYDRYYYYVYLTFTTGRVSLVTYSKAYKHGLGHVNVNNVDVGRHQKTIMQTATAAAPRNSAAALSLAVDPMPTRVERCTIVPKSLAGISDPFQKRRGPVPKHRTGNFGKVQVRQVGLDGCTIRTRVFDTPEERKIYRQQQRRSKRMVHTHTHTCRRWDPLGTSQDPEQAATRNSKGLLVGTRLIHVIRVGQIASY